MTTVLLWDIDGTLLTTGRAGVFALEEAASAALGGRQVDLSDMDTAGLTDGEIVAAVLAREGAEPTQESVAAFLRDYERLLPDRLGWRQGRVLDGVEAVLDDLRGRDGVLSLLLTGNTEAGASAKLSHYGLDRYFDRGAFCLDWEDRGSIAHRAVTLAAELTGEPPAPDSLVVIGDTPADVHCGHEIGARTLAVASGSYSRAELEVSGARAVIDQVPPPVEFEGLVGIK